MLTAISYLEFIMCSVRNTIVVCINLDTTVICDFNPSLVACCCSTVSIFDFFCCSVLNELSNSFINSVLNASIKGYLDPVTAETLCFEILNNYLYIGSACCDCLGLSSDVLTLILNSCLMVVCCSKIGNLQAAVFANKLKHAVDCICYSQGISIICYISHHVIGEYLIKVCEVPCNVFVNVFLKFRFLRLRNFVTYRSLERNCCKAYA